MNQPRHTCRLVNTANNFAKAFLKVNALIGVWRGDGLNHVIYLLQLVYIKMTFMQKK